MRQRQRQQESTDKFVFPLIRSAAPVAVHPSRVPRSRFAQSHLSLKSWMRFAIRTCSVSYDGTPARAQELTRFYSPWRQAQRYRWPIIRECYPK